MYWVVQWFCSIQYGNVTRIKPNQVLKEKIRRPSTEKENCSFDLFLESAEKWKVKRPILIIKEHPASWMRLEWKLNSKSSDIRSRLHTYKMKTI